MRGSSALVIAVLFGAISPLTANSGEYVVDPDRSEMVVRLFKGGFASGLAHDHVIRASQFGGTMFWDPDQPASAKVEVRSDARALIIDEPEVRARYELEGELADDKRQDVQATMESAKQLDVEAYPDMLFRSTSVRQFGNGSIEVSGDLTLHGSTRSIRFTTSPALEGGSLTASAEIDFLQSDFGIKPYSAMLGAVKNQDGAKLLVRLVATPVAPGEDRPAETSGSDE